MTQQQAEFKTIDAFPELATTLQQPGLHGKPTRQLAIVARYARAEASQGHPEFVTRANALCDTLLPAQDPTVRLAAETVLAHGLSPDHRCPQTGTVPASLSSRWEHERFTPWP